jgi:cell filamentation protein
MIWYAIILLTTPATPLHNAHPGGFFIILNLIKGIFMSDRYFISTDEAYEPGSNDEVLKNFIGVKEKNIIEQLEARELMKAEQEIFSMYEQTTKFTAEDICNMHKLWLGNIYPFAGKYRTVNMSKGDFLFAAACRIDCSMQDYQKKYLSKYTPCMEQNDDDLALALAIVHIEFIIIHPFREGNGRIGRMLAVLMALQAGKPPLNFNVIDQTKNLMGFQHYINAIHAGVDTDYLPMQKIFAKIIEESAP